MRKLLLPLDKFLARIQKRFQSSRPGSVMILVITLLVLMALIGTAYISTARTDRYTALMHGINTQADLLIEAVKQMAMSGFGSPNPSRPDDTQTDTWMASRYPMSLADAVGTWNGNSISYARGQWAQWNNKFYV